MPDTNTDTELRRAWDERVDACLRRAADRVPRSPFLLGRTDARAFEPAMVDWTGLPLRTVACLPRQDALTLLDWRGVSGCEGRLRVQDEYLEWRTVRDADGGIRRVELTCELPELWRTLAAHAPRVALCLAAQNAGVGELAPDALFGDLDPFADGVGADEREGAFAAAMLDAPGPYNNGDHALCCMVHPSNTLEAIATLLAAAAFAFTLDDHEAVRCLPARAVIPLLEGAAQDGRSSDPLVVERLGRLASEGRVVTVDHPHALAIVGIEHARLRRPGGHAVPNGWWHFARPVAPGRCRRVTLEVPPGEGIRVGDLVDLATEEPITQGGQIADLVQVALLLRTSPPAIVPVERRRGDLVEPIADATGCAAIRGAWQAYTDEAQRA